jgi:hypothetical protein
MAKNDKNIAEYLIWLTNNYLKLFKYHYGELVLIESQFDEIEMLHKGFKPLSFSPDVRVFYSKHNKEETKYICELFKIKHLKGKIIPLYPSILLIAFSQQIIHGTDYLNLLSFF